MKKLYKGIINILACTGITVTAYGQKMEVYKNVIEQEIEVTVENLNIRTGPGMDYPVVGTVANGQILDVIGTLNNWYIVLLPDNSVGLISSSHTKVHKMGENIYIEGSLSFDNFSEEGQNETDQEKMFRLVNYVRMENNLEAYAWDEKLNRVAELKAQDMADNDYFGHDSPSYGTPYAMLKQMDVYYKSATENIARNTSVENAHIDIMTSIHHRVNVLSARYNKMGIGVAESEWGRIIVQIFIEE